jgi:hypothetical protein
VTFGEFCRRNWEKIEVLLVIYDPTRGDRGMTDRDVSAPTGSFDRYDLILLVIPAAFAVGILATVLSSLPPQVGVAFAGAVGLAAVGDALFLHPPNAGVGD